MKVYYPSRFNFLWYASRTLFLLENEFQRFDSMKKSFGLEDDFVKRFQLLEDIFAEAKGYLKEAFEKSATEFLISSAIKDKDPAGSYFCDFLGMNDTNIFGKQEPSNDDCLFSTAQAVNILIATWTFQDLNTKSLHWKTETPGSVKSLVKSCVDWLMEYALGKKYKPLNAFFSGSVKGLQSNPYVYPANFAQYTNETNVDPNNISPYSNFLYLIYGVEGSPFLHHLYQIVKNFLLNYFIRNHRRRYLSETS